jgi:protein-tyrosine phosphatase
MSTVELKILHLEENNRILQNCVDQIIKLKNLDEPTQPHNILTKIVDIIDEYEWKKNRLL